MQQSSITFLVAKQRVAQAAAAQGDTTQLTRAGYSVQAAFKHLNNEPPMPFMLTLATDTTVAASDDEYGLPADFRNIYTARLIDNPRRLRPITVRLYDSIRQDQTSEGTPTHYEILRNGTGADAIRLFPVPSAADTLRVRYYRRLTVPSVDGTALDIPEDFDEYVIAFAKWHYLTDKGESTARTGEWKEYWLEGWRRMRADSGRQPDDTESFMPALDGLSAYNPNSIFDPEGFA